MILFVKYIIIYKLEAREKFNCSLPLIVYDDSIGITIEDTFSTCTFLIDTFSDYITIFRSLPRSSY